MELHVAVCILGGHLTVTHQISRQVLCGLKGKTTGILYTHVT